MSGIDQFDSHPDADQIGAFVEHALPAHERERMFAHLAVCPECREIVMLSMPDEGEAAATTPAHAAPRRWRTGLTLAWSGAAVLAAVAAIAIYLHHPVVAHRVQPSSQVAAVREQAQTTAQRPPASLAAKPAAHGSLASSEIKRPATVESGAAGNFKRGLAAEPQPGPADKMPIENRKLNALKELNAAPQIRWRSALCKAPSPPQVQAALGAAQAARNRPLPADGLFPALRLSCSRPRRGSQHPRHPLRRHGRPKAMRRSK